MTYEATMTYESQKRAFTVLSVGEKVKLLRKHNRISQAMLAEIMKVRPERIVKVERGDDTYTEAHINAIKQHLDIVELPLTNREFITFKERMYYWRELIRARQLDEARAIREEVVNINKIKPYDQNIVMLCKMMEVQLLLTEGNKDLAEEMLDMAKNDLDTVADECLVHYYFNKGLLYGKKKCYEECLDFSLKAYYLTKNHENLLPEKDGWLYYNIAWCYSYIEIPYRAIDFFKMAQQVTLRNSSATFTRSLNASIALNYIKTNQIKDAERLLSKIKVRAESLKDDNYIGLALYCYGYMYKQLENWASAIVYFDKALKCLDKDTDNYHASLYYKIYCTIHTRKFPKAKQQLDDAKAECSTNKPWSMYFEALGHYLKISTCMTSRDNDESIDYIENTVIPFIVKGHDYLGAVDYYNLLQKHYEKIKSTMKSLMMTVAIHDIYKRCYINQERND